MSTNKNDTAPPVSAQDEDIQLALMKQSDRSLTLMARAEIDQAIATAQAFPRSLTLFKRDLYDMATLDQDTAEACTYAVPRGGKTVQGKSIRFAEMVLATYHNIRSASRVVGRQGTVIICEAVVHDLQTNAGHREEVERRITDKNGKLYSEDMQVVTGRAGCAIALRNAIFRVVPGALYEDVYQKVKLVARGDEKTLPQRREIRINYFKALGIKPAQIFEALEVKGVDDIGLDKLFDLQGMVNAHKAGEATLEELFPPPNAGKKATKATEDKLKASGKASQGAKETASHMEGHLDQDKPIT